MRPRWTLATPILLVACTTAAPEDGGEPEAPSAVSGLIGRDQIWRGTVNLLDDTVIDDGVTVTVEAGAEILAQDGKSLTVRGTLLVDGTAEAPVALLPERTGTVWAGVVAESGGAVTMRHVVGTDVATLLYCHAGAAACALSNLDFAHIGNALVAEGTAVLERSRIIDTANGGVSVRGDAGDLTIRHSFLLTSTHDLVVQVGGRMVIEYSEIGETNGSYEHCDIHIGASAYTSITHSTLRSGVYGMMIGGTDGAIIQYNNFIENDPGQDLSEVGDNLNVDMRFNYWDQGAPLMDAAFNFAEPAPSAYPDARPLGL